MTKLKERLERRIENKAKEYSEGGLIGDWSMMGNYSAGAESLVPLILELATALRDLSERHKWQPEMGECICPQHIAAQAALMYVDEFLGDE